jgi:hypothetical protein
LAVLGHAKVERQDHRVDLARRVDNNLGGDGPSDSGLCDDNGCRLLARSERVIPCNGNPAFDVVGLLEVSMSLLCVESSNLPGQQRGSWHS